MKEIYSLILLHGISNDLPHSLSVVENDIRSQYKM